MTRRSIIVLLSALAAPTALLAGDEVGGDRVTVRRVHWPVLVEPARGDASANCATPRPGWIEVREDGEPRPVTAIGPRPRPRLHALLVDTSNSMRPKLRDAVEAARRYLDSLPPDDAGLLATFGDNLVLRVPPTLDRDALRTGLDELSTGNMTALWDALYYLVRYLGPLDREKIVVLITDGEDSASLERHALDDVLDLARATPDLTVFPIGLDLRASGASGFSLARHQLTEVARQTGGEFYEPGSATRLAGVFDRVRRRMAERLYVSYVPAPFGQGPSDGGDSENLRWRKVSVRASPDSPCRVVRVGAPRRLARRRGGGGLLREPPGREDSVMTREAFGSCDVDVDPTTVSARLSLAPDTPLLGEVERGSRLYPFRGRRGFAGFATDIVVERGPLFADGDRRGRRRPKTTLDREPVFEERGFTMAAPELHSLRDELSSPAAVLLHLLRHEACAPDPTDAHPHARSAPFVHGQTFLELRELLGRALFTTHEDYATWAVRRTTVEIDSRLPRILETIPGADAFSPEQRTAVRDSLVDRESDPESGSAHTRLAEWLGDVTASDAALDLERRVMNDLLEGRGNLAAETVVGSWSKLGRWFPQATQIRIVTPLIPAYDPRRELIGFYRFLLPAPTLSRRGTDPIPSRPLGLLTLMTLLDGPETGPILERSGLRVASLRYAPVTKRELRRSACGLDPRVERHEIERVTIAFRKGRSGEISLRLGAFFSHPRGTTDSRPGPECLDLEEPERASPLGKELASAWAQSSRAK